MKQSVFPEFLSSKFKQPHYPVNGWTGKSKKKHSRWHKIPAALGIFWFTVAGPAALPAQFSQPKMSFFLLTANLSNANNSSALPATARANAPVAREKKAKAGFLATTVLVALVLLGLGTALALIRALRR